jgi:hypothetical protein
MGSRNGSPVRRGLRAARGALLGLACWGHAHFEARRGEVSTEGKGARSRVLPAMAVAKPPATSPMPVAAADMASEPRVLVCVRTPSQDGVEVFATDAEVPDHEADSGCTKRPYRPMPRATASRKMPLGVARRALARPASAAAQQTPPARCEPSALWRAVRRPRGRRRAPSSWSALLSRHRRSRVPR